MLNQQETDISVFDARISDAIKASIPDFDYLESSEVSSKDFRKVYSTLIIKNGESECRKLIQVFINYCIESNRVDKEKLFQPIIKVPRLPAPINRSNHDDVRKLKLFDSQFLNELEDLKSISDNKLISMILYSAIRYGLLLDNSLIKSLSKALSDKPYVYKDKIWFQLNIEETSRNKESTHIWQPDSFTLLLLHTWYKKKRHVSHQFWYKLLRNTLNENGLLAKSHHLFLANMKNYLKMAYPSFVIEAKSKLKNNRSLDFESFLHQQTGAAPRLAAQGYPETNDRKQKVLLEANTLKRQVLNTIHTHACENEELSIKVKSVIENSTAPMPAKSVASCFTHYLTNKNSLGNRYKLNWLKRILNQLTESFVSAFGDQDPARLSDEHLQSGYQSIIDACAGAQVENMCKFLKAYQYYLHAAHGRGFNTKLLPTVITQHPNAHGQIISESQYQLMQQWVDRELTSASETKKPIFISMKTCLILGYRLGLRRSEIMGLRTQDIHIAGRSELIICGYQIDENTRYELKSKNSNRKIRLHHQMPDAEFEFILNYVKERSQGKDSFHLINWDNSNLIKNRTDRIFRKITKIMRWVTGRQDARFHELRHSRATLKIWHCYIAAYDLNPLFNKHASCDDLNRIKKHLEYNFSAEWQNNRHKILHYLSAEMGHASPATTLANYIHSIDWIADELREKQLPLIGTKTLSQLIGLTRRQIQFIAKKENLITHNQKAGHSPAILRNNLLKQLDKIASQPELRHWHVKGLTDLPEDKSELQDTYLPELQVYHAVKTHLFEGKNIEDIQRSYLDIAEQIQPAIERAQQKNLFPRYIHQVLKQRNTKKSYYLLESIISAYRNMYDKENGKDQTRQQDRAIVRALAKQVTDPEFHMNTASSGYNLHQKRDLQKFIRAIRLLNQYRTAGVPIQLELTLYSSNPLDTAARNSDWARWSKAILVPQNTVFKNDIISAIDTNYPGRFQAIERVRVKICDNSQDSEIKTSQPHPSYLYNPGFDTAMRVIVMLDDSYFKNRP